MNLAVRLVLARQFDPLHLTRPLGAAPPRLREGGVYLLTGGLGGIGLAILGAASVVGIWAALNW